MVNFAHYEGGGRMAKIVVPRNGCLAAKKAKIVAPYSSEYYRKLVEEADARIREAKTREARAYLRAEKTIAL